MKKNLYPIIVFFMFSIGLAPAFAQKLPNTQPGSVKAPADVKIDGLPLEVGNKFQAYNTSTDIYYTLSNNASYLYLIVQARDMDIIKKISRGGIRVTVNPKANRLSLDCRAVEFPLINLSDGSRLSQVVDELKDAKTNRGIADSLTRVYNSLLAPSSKELKISVTNSYRDSTISIYNQSQIFVHGALATDLSLTYEFKIPFSYLGFEYASGNKIYYNIQLNGRSSQTMAKPAGVRVASATGVSISNVSMSLYTPTDFWAAYQLH